MRGADGPEATAPPEPHPVAPGRTGPVRLGAEAGGAAGASGPSLRAAPPPPMRPALVLAALAVGASLSACDRPDLGALAPGLDELPDAPDTPPAWAAEAVWYEVDVDLFRDGDPENGPGARADSARADSARARAEAADSTAADSAIGGPGQHGGDLQGVLDALPELAELGVTAIALGDLADPAAPHHVAPRLGPDPAGDRERTALETADDPETWATTAADRLLLDLVEAAHERGLRVVPDGPWAAVDTSSQETALAAAVRWLDPDGDGDPSDGVDGFRLTDVEARPVAFWRVLRRATKALHPEAVLVAVLGRRLDGATVDPAPWLGAPFDAVADDRAFLAIRPFLDARGPRRSAAALADDLAELYAAVPPDHLPAVWTTAGGPGTARLAEALGPVGAGPARRSGAQTVELYRLLQATLPGAPHVLYGDEDDPASPVDTSAAAPRDARRALAGGVRDVTARALALRHQHADLFAHGTLLWEPFGDVLRFVRQTETGAAVVVVNLSDRPWRVPEGTARVALSVGPAPVALGGAYLVAPGAGAVFLADADVAS